MNAALRETLRQAIDRRRREQLFTVNQLGRTILKPEYQARTGVPSLDGAVAGISHSTWGYRKHGCRCDVCSDAMRRSMARRRR